MEIKKLGGPCVHLNIIRDSCHDLHPLITLEEGNQAFCHIDI